VSGTWADCAESEDDGSGNRSKRMDTSCERMMVGSFVSAWAVMLPRLIKRLLLPPCFEVLSKEEGGELESELLSSDEDEIPLKDDKKNIKMKKAGDIDFFMI